MADENKIVARHNSVEPGTILVAVDQIVTLEFKICISLLSSLGQGSSNETSI